MAEKIAPLGFNAIYGLHYFTCKNRKPSIHGPLKPVTVKSSARKTLLPIKTG
jgi:hypothetical protein